MFVAMVVRARRWSVSFVVFQEIRFYFWIFSFLKDPESGNKNLQFYCNEIKSSTILGSTIEDMLKWKGKYSELEGNYEYIQWLFPIPGSRGININAQPLGKKEAEKICKNATAHGRVLEAYKMMLDFFGMRLTSVVDGTIGRHENYKERYVSLNRNVYRFKFITRILKSLGELGYERFQLPWVTFLIEEVVVHKMLPNVDDLTVKFWINAIKDHDNADECMEHYKSLAKGPNALKQKSYGNFGNGNTACVGNVEILKAKQMTEINSRDHRDTVIHVRDCEKGKDNHTSGVDKNETRGGEEETITDFENLINSTEEILQTISMDFKNEMINQFDCVAKKMEELR